MVNTILKEADLFCPNSVRINFTIYHGCNYNITNKGHTEIDTTIDWHFILYGHRYQLKIVMAKTEYCCIPFSIFIFSY
uniref:Uncharacterized protein n=1 Tax=Companilactobacillus formosensis TaxID=1617889 RepID=A0A2P4R7R7_9LACO